ARPRRARAAALPARDARRTRPLSAAREGAREGPWKRRETAGASGRAPRAACASAPLLPPAPASRCAGTPRRESWRSLRVDRGGEGARAASPATFAEHGACPRADLEPCYCSPEKHSDEQHDTLY